jgi:glutamine---fructose-6-phosphate transaminase (isomerizing)
MTYLSVPIYIYTYNWSYKWSGKTDIKWTVYFISYFEMCGIVGFLGKRGCIQHLLVGLNILQNRGYDSTGISYIENGNLITRKYASSNTHNSLDTLKKSLEQVSSEIQIGIAHTRWATHGGKTDANAHPHTDTKNRISLVHNGIIENYEELKTELLLEGATFASHTDTEVIALLIAKYLDQGYMMEAAIQHTVIRMSGTWAIAIVHRDYPNKLWITRNGSPLLLGIEDEYVLVASEHSAFGNAIKKYIIVDNHDIIEISNENDRIKFNTDICRYTINYKTGGAYDILPCTYPHWMLKEIKEQASSIHRAMNNGGRIYNGHCVKLGGLDENRDQLLALNHIVILGCGTSHNAGQWAAAMFKMLDIMDTVAVFDGADFSKNDLPKSGKTGLILLSQSGETKDLHRCIHIAGELDLVTIGIVNVVDSMIARETTCGVYLNAGREVAVASTKSFTNQCVVLAMVAIWFSQNKPTHFEKRKQIISDMRNLPNQVDDLVNMAEGFIYSIIPQFREKTSAFILGKGSAHAVAEEGALKMKEVTYIHAEGYSTTALKHGPFALIDANTPILLLDVDSEHRDKTRNAYQEIAARNGPIIKITTEVSNCTLNTLVIPHNRTFGAILANVAIQLLSYYLAVDRGINPDFPRNLAKVVTVE